MRPSSLLGICSLILLLAGFGALLVPAISVASFKISQTGASITAGQRVVIPLQATNGGFLSVRDFQVNLSVLSSTGELLGTGSSVVMVVAPGQSVLFNVTVSPTDQTGIQNSPANLTLRVSASMNVGGVLPMQIIQESQA